MPELVPKWTRASPRMQIFPRKSHKKLLRIGKNEWLKINGGIHVVKGGPPYAFEYRRKLKAKKKGSKSSKRIMKTRRKSHRSSMSAAAKKAWVTRRKRGH